MLFLRPASRFLAGPFAAVLLVVGGCGSLRQIQVFTVSIVNDTGQAVVLRDAGQRSLVHRCPSRKPLPARREDDRRGRRSRSLPSLSWWACRRSWSLPPADAADLLSQQPWRFPIHGRGEPRPQLGGAKLRW